MKEEIQKRIAEIEKEMAEPGFWQNKARAQELVREYENFKAELAGAGRFDKGSAVISIIAGAGGTDAEDFARMLSQMYFGFAAKAGWGLKILHENINDFGGYRNIVFEVAAPKGRGSAQGGGRFWIT